MVGIIHQEGDDADPLQKWYSDQKDLRFDEQIINQVMEFIKQHKAVTVVTPERIIGCPHEEGIDYAEGTSCPECPYWEGRDRWTGDMENESKLINSTVVF